MTIVTQENFNEEITTLLNNLVDDSDVIIDIESNGTDLFSNQLHNVAGIFHRHLHPLCSLTMSLLNILKKMGWVEDPAIRLRTQLISNPHHTMHTHAVAISP